MSWMLLPVLACAVIVLTLGWFGLHVLQRGVIFVDLALAQIAALGTTWAVFLGHEPDSPAAFVLALAFTLAGATAFAAARVFDRQVPQEALIGIAYAVSAAAGILMIHFAEDAHGGEKLEHLLVGNIVWVQFTDLALLTATCGAVGLLHLAFRERFLQISFRPAEARAEGRRVGLWDVLFYASFGTALTSIVSVSGVILVFSYLVIPAVIARLHVDGVVGRLVAAWLVGLGVSVAGVAVSYTHPTGPVIVVFFGIALLVALIIAFLRESPSPGRAAGQVLLAAATMVGGLWLSYELPAEHDGHGHETHDHPAPLNQPDPGLTVSPTPPGTAAAADAAEAPSGTSAAPEAGGAPPGTATALPDAAAREAAARAATTPEELTLLSESILTEQDSSVRLVMAVILLRAGHRRGLDALLTLVRDDLPFVRMEADALLRKLAGRRAPTWDPLAGPDTGAWAAWAETIEGVPIGARELEVP